jgi:7,8-dihydroneopterin aldolase/epimerase/oxygenase
MDTIFIRDMIVRGIIGVHAQERQQPQDFVINIDLATNVEQAGITDNVFDSVDYQSVADTVSAHASSVGRYTVEALAADVAEIVLADSRIERVRVRIDKPGAVPGSRSVGVEIDRSRDWLVRRRQNQHPDPNRVDLPGYHCACLGLGSNTDVSFNLSEAIRKLGNELVIDAVSSAWESSAIGDAALKADLPDYINAALLVRTRSTKDDLVASLKRIENELGRVRSDGPNKQVTIDIDLLIFEGVILKKDLWTLAYRAIPVAELIPSLSSSETSEPIWKAAHRLATATRILPRFDLLRLTPPL